MYGENVPSVLRLSMALRRPLSIFFTTKSGKPKRQDESASTCESTVAVPFWLRAWKSLLLGAENAIQFLHQFKELLSILFHGNARTQFVNAVVLCLVHVKPEYYELPLCLYVRCRTKFEIAVQFATMLEAKVAIASF